MKSHKALSFLAAACLCLSAAPLPVMADFSRTNCSYYYDKLDTDAQMLYNNLYAAALKVDTSDAYYAYAPEAYYTGLTDEQMEDIVVLFTYDHPEFFWLANYYQYGWSWNGSYVSLQVYPDFQDGAERQTARTRLQEIEKGYVAGAMQYDTDYERSKYLANQLHSDIEYETGDLDQSLASALLEKKTVCAGFTKAYSLLANASGVDTIALHGTGHGWNASKIADRWYHVDVTNSLFLYSDSQIGAFDQRVGYYTATYSDGTQKRYLMHDNDFAYYNDLSPDMSREYDGSSQPVAAQTPAETEPPTEASTELPTESTPTETTTLYTTTSTTPATTETTTTTTFVLPTEEPTATTPDETSPLPMVSCETEGETFRFYADDTTPFSLRKLVSRLSISIDYGNGSTRRFQTTNASVLTIDDAWATPALVYAQKGCYHGGIRAYYESIPVEVGDVYIMQQGDFDGNGVVNAADGAGVLIYAASIGAGTEPVLPEGMDLETAIFAGKMNDLDSNRNPTAADAALILIYAAQVGAGEIG